MKRNLLSALLVLSLAMNIGVAATVGWQLWAQSSQVTPDIGADQMPASPLQENDFKTIRGMWSQQARESMFALRGEIEKKNLELIDFITKHPGTSEEVRRSVDELLALRYRMEQEAFNRITTVMATLPEEKRAAFAFYVKNRSCVGPGSMGRSRGRGQGGAACWCGSHPVRSRQP